MKRKVLYETVRKAWWADKVKRSRSFYESYKAFCKLWAEPRFILPLKSSFAYKEKRSIRSLQKQKNLCKGLHSFLNVRHFAWAVQRPCSTDITQWKRNLQVTMEFISCNALERENSLVSGKGQVSLRGGVLQSLLWGITSWCWLAR